MYVILQRLRLLGGNVSSRIRVGNVHVAHNLLSTIIISRRKHAFANNFSYNLTTALVRLFLYFLLLTVIN